MHNLTDLKNYFYHPLLKYHTKNWPNYSHLITKSDNSPWVLDEIEKEMISLFSLMGINCVPQKYIKGSKNQCIFYFNKYDILSKWNNLNHRIAFPYYHGDPRINNQFSEFFEVIKKNHSQIDRIQVSHNAMKNLILETGIDPIKVFKIPISININNFRPNSSKLRNHMRTELQIDDDTILIGSFQKDGNYWNKGNEPKLIKGPDIFIETIKILKKKYGKVTVLLTGPSRGYIKNELKKLNVPYIHRYPKNFFEIAKYYYPLDIYLISSREEGGPRSVLESMACSIPLVSTKVGQAADLIENSKNGWLVDNFDPSKLADTIIDVIESNYINQTQYIEKSRKTAVDNSYKKQIDLWKSFMKGFLNEIY